MTTSFTYRDGDGLVIIHCLVEKDRIYCTAQLLEQLPGVIKLEPMDGNKVEE